MAHYYARFLGMEDTISEEDLLLGVTKTELEKDMGNLKQVIKNLCNSHLLLLNPKPKNKEKLEITNNILTAKKLLKV